MTTDTNTAREDLLRGLKHHLSGAMLVALSDYAPREGYTQRDHIAAKVLEAVDWWGESVASTHAGSVRSGISGGATTEVNLITEQLAGRIAYLRNAGRVKDPQLMQAALDALNELGDACSALLAVLGEPEDGMQAKLMQQCRNVITNVFGGSHDHH